MESSPIFLIDHLKQENGASAQPVSAIKKLCSDTHPQIKLEDRSVKQNILIACTGLALALFSCLKWPILKKIMDDSMDVVQYFFLCVFILGQFKE